MKNLTNILSYLWLLLLMAVTACSDLENEVDEMQQQLQEADLVELNIQLHVPNMQASTRTAPTENITAITAYAFDGNSQLIKMVKAILSDDKQATSGDLKIKVPKRTGDIHFIAKNNAESPDDVTISIGNNVSTLLSHTTDDLYYWGKATYNGGNNLSVTLIRNMAKVTLILNNDLQGHIAGFVNYNQTGTLVPGNFEVGTLNATNNDEASHNSDSELGIEHNLFEHANVKDSSPLFAICKIGDLYYKIAFANANKEYFPIIRNHAYTITINSVEESLGRSYDEALLADPINDANVEVQDVTMEIRPVSLTSYKGNTCQVTVTIPNGVTELSVTPDDDAFSVTSATLDDVAISPNNDVYIVTGGNTAKFSLTLNDNFIGTTGGHTISFEGSGALVNATGTATITLNGFMNSYEMYFDGGNLGGSTEYDKFFHTRQGTISTGDASGLETTFYDDGANSHKYKHLLMNSNNNSFSFTIADTRYLTLLVAKSGDAPSINLLKDGNTWTATSDKEQVPDTYNFSKDGDITTAGRLIRYTLPAGTYTLQRGNNDYLLYYMRVTKDKPTMTDIVQPSAAHYNLSWTGGEYGNSLKNGTKYYVDDDATIFTPKLTYLGLSEMPLTTTSVTVVTDTLYFKDNAPNVSGTTIIKKTETKSYNGSNPTLEFNAGTYNNLCGTIENIAETSYKYMAFYDAIQLKEVSGIEVRNTIKVGLYDDWYSTEALDHYTEGKLMMTGFKMPTHTIPVPVTEGENGTVTSIEFKIDNWTRDQSGLGIDFSNAPTYTYRFTAQDETNGNNIIRTHPRPEWIYRIQWANVAAESMTVVITDNSSDAYFSHGEQIGKSVTIQTHVENTSLDIDLDFYADINGNSQIVNRDNNVYEDLLLGTSSFYLKATISKEDATKYAGQSVTLVNTFSGNGYQYANSNGAIHWDDSSIDNNINSNGDATKLSFIVDANTTEYVIEWVFVTGQHYRGGDIGFAYSISTYTISDVSYNNIDGDKSATIAFTNEPVIYCKFNDGLDGFTHNGQGSVSSNNGTLILNNGTDRANAYDAQAMYETDKIQYEATYTLTFKAKIEEGTTGGLVVAIQSGGGTYTYYYVGKIISDIFNNVQKDDQGWAEIVFDNNMNITNNDNKDNPTHFMFNFGDLVGTLYIDDVKLVKN